MLRPGEKIIVFDGGFGSELERKGLGGIPEDLNITHPEDIIAIHRSYSSADIITANTFGLNRVKYHGNFDLSELAQKAVENARAAGKAVFWDVGPTGAMLEPLGTLTFDDAYSTYAEVAEISKDLVDGYIAETFSDLYELKACVLALKEHTDRPIFATMTFDKSGRTLTGSTPEIVAYTLEGLGVDALGVNCSLGPRELLPTVKRLLNATELPIIVQPNRGLPVLENGKAVYKLSADEFEKYVREMVDMGVAIVGGCCGTTPEFINQICDLSQTTVKPRTVKRRTYVCSANMLVEIDGGTVCGERINPTGKKLLKEAILSQNYDYIADLAVKQQSAGAMLLDVNVGLPGTDEKASMTKVVKTVQQYCDLPLQIDSSNPDTIEAGVRYYNGIPLINSVNGDEESMSRIFPIAKKYGAVVLGLAMDKNGIPRTAEERFEIADRIISRVQDYGIPREKIMIDTLTVTASAEQALVSQTLKALELVKTLGVKTALGVSNVSYGLPNRPLLNRTFLTVALSRGLDMPIIDPLDQQMIGAIKAYRVLSGVDENSSDYIETYRDSTVPPSPTAQSGDISLYDCVKLGLKGRAEEMCERELQSIDAMSVVDGILIKALGEVGELYESGKLFLPQLISSAEAAKAAFAAVGRHMPKDAPKKGRVVLATVRGDVHDIGKNIVKVVLESYGYTVTDLGKDVPKEKVVDACKEVSPIAVGLSALMTTTVGSMEETIAALRAAKCDAKIFVGGAVLNAETAERIGADYYTRDALEMAKLLDSLFAKE